MEKRISRTSSERNLGKSCYGHNRKLFYTAKRQIFRTSIFILVHIHTFHFNFYSHSGKPLYAERGIVHLTLSRGTD